MCQFSKKKAISFKHFWREIQMNVARFARNMWQNATFFESFSNVGNACKELWLTVCPTMTKVVSCPLKLNTLYASSQLNWRKASPSSPTPKKLCLVSTL